MNTLIETLDCAITNRISQPLVGRAYEEWKARGLLTETQSFLSSLDSSKLPPVVHSFVTHVHKEKGLFLDLIGEDIGIDIDARKSLAMSADILWALSLMVDDIEDNDVVRGGLTSCWVEFGVEKTLEATNASIKSLCKYLVNKTNLDVVPRSCMSYINIGLSSIREHGLMDLETPVGELVRNYERRCDFHGTFPLSVFAQLVLPDQQPKLNNAIAGLRLFNQGGQLINDLKDFVGGDLYGRSFSDIRRGVPTVPLSYLYHSLNDQDKKTFKSIYDKGVVTVEDRIVLAKLIESSKVEENTLARVKDCYNGVIKYLSQVVTTEHMDWFIDWADYKINHLKQSLKHE